MVFGIARLFGTKNRPALHRASMLRQGGEFAFVLYTAARAGGVIDARETALFSTVVILSMAITPILMLVADRMLQEPVSMDGSRRPGI